MTTAIRDEIKTSVLRDNDDPNPRKIVVRLEWSTDNPFAVKWTFLSTSGGDVTWQLSRELLAESLITYDELGIGDVRVQRFINACAVRLEFNAPSGSCIAVTCSTPLTTFLNATYRLAPPGGDVETEAVEHALAELLAQADE